MKNTLSKLLGGQPKLSELEAARAELQRREAEITARIEAIKPGSNAAFPAGPERARVEVYGTPDELVALDQELARLKAERAALPAKYEALRQREGQAAADDAARELPAQIKALPATLKKWQAAQAAADQAKAELREAMTAITVGRRTLESVGRSAPGVSSEVAVQIVDALGLKKPDGAMKYSLSRAEWFRRLGAPQIEREAAKRAAKSMGQRDSFAAKNDPEELARHPERSIWARRPA